MHVVVKHVICKAIQMKRVTEMKKNVLLNLGFKYIYNQFDENM